MSSTKGNPKCIAIMIMSGNINIISVAKNSNCISQNDSNEEIDIRFQKVSIGSQFIFWSFGMESTWLIIILYCRNCNIIFLRLHCNSSLPANPCAIILPRDIRFVNEIVSIKAQRSYINLHHIELCEFHSSN